MIRHKFSETDPRIKILIYESFGFKARANRGKTRLNRRTRVKNLKILIHRLFLGDSNQIKRGFKAIDCVLMVVSLRWYRLVIFN